MMHPHTGHHGPHPAPRNFIPWWRGWSGNWTTPVVNVTQPDSTPLYFLGGAVLLGALMLRR